MPPVKPCSSRSRSNIRFDVCCCFFGRPLSSARMPSMIAMNGSSFARTGRFDGRYQGGTANSNLLSTVLGSTPSLRTNPRMVSTSIPTAWRTFIEFHVCHPTLPLPNQAQSFQLPDLYSGPLPNHSVASIEGFLLRRLQVSEWSRFCHALIDV